MDPAGVGDYFLGETVTGTVSGVTAEVSFWNRDTDQLILINRTGNFYSEEQLIGSESGTSRDVVLIDNLLQENIGYSDNKYIEEAGDEILDFSERNPFGEYGQVTGEF